ncbi:Mitogen-activated protein kinase kinase kinase [Quillaja saponaria]|uniref:Mitogen-activated protein kinase kinase kinase n=1 Tax=Quillaja saponaria TaxID=32244 RepID=A0AAD7L2K0_QUISA|nr:Mitogen-activated protein kinase kinase kinase [Quillaja saponaria]
MERIRPTREARWVPGRQIKQEPVSIVPNSAKDVNSNVFVYRGEEMPMEFVHDRIAGRRMPPASDISQNHEKRGGINKDNGHIRYEDLTGILGLRRMDSENTSDIYEFPSAKGSYQEIENGVSLSKYQKGDGERGHCPQRSSNSFGESICDQSSLGPNVPTLHKSDSPSSKNFLGSDGSQSGKMKLLCSFGGKILPRPSDGKLRYVGGETRIISIHKNISWQELVNKTLGICNQPHSIKYQLPDEDLDALISVSSDEDLQNMIEEYYGLERHEGSQRLRIFLIPLAEQERTSSFDASSIQESDPDYQYVVAVNCMVDPSPRKNISGQSLTSEASPLGPNCAPSFHNNSPTALSPLETKGGYSALNPTEFFNDSMNSHRLPNHSPPFSPIPLQQGDSSVVHVQLHGDDSCQVQGHGERSTSFTATQLQPEDSSMGIAAGLRHPRLGGVTFVSDHHPHEKPGLQDQSHEVLFRNHNSNKELGMDSTVVKNASDGDGFSFVKPLHKERSFQSGTSVKCLEDPTNVLSGSNGTSEPFHGMLHAFSDSKLHESGVRLAYCSLEGINQSSSLDITKTQLTAMVASSVSHGNSTQLHQSSNLVYPHIQSKQPDALPLELQRRHDLPYSETFGRREPIHGDFVGTDERYLTAQNDISRSSFSPNKCDENCTPLELINRDGEKYAFFKNDGQLCERRSPATHVESMSNLNILPASQLEVKSNIENMQFSENVVPSSSALDLNHCGNMTEHKVNYRVSKYPSDLLGMSERTMCDKEFAFSGMLTGEQGINSSWTRNSDVVDSFSKCKEHPYDENSLSYLMSGLPINPVSQESARFQPADQKNMGFSETQIESSTSWCPTAIQDDPGPSSNFHRNTPHNPTIDVAFKREPSLLGDDFVIGTHQMDEKKLVCGDSALKPKFEDIMLGQTNSLEKSNDLNELEPLVIMEDATHAVPPGILSSLAAVPHVADETGSGALSPSAAEVESVVPESESEDAIEDDENQNESLSDAMIAEMEASIYGLQIIKNADLEELRELGSGTYGTVYHGKWRGTDVAIKRIKKSCFAGRGSEQERLTKDFWREAQILSNLHHPNVLAFYGVVPDGTGGTLATVTEYMVNGSLRHVLLKKDRSLDRRKKLIIAMDAAFGMEYLHSKNIVHFDLKCDNLLVNLRDPQRPICKVGDFGLSRIKRNTLVSGGVRGTLPWMAPELLSGSSSRVSEKVDVFSFGISMWEILTGEEPYADMHCGAIIGGIVKNSLRPLIPERCDPEWRKLMEQCWSADPESRPSFTEITNRLRSMSMTLQAKAQNTQAKQMRPHNPS